MNHALRLSLRLLLPRPLLCLVVAGVVSVSLTAVPTASAQESAAAIDARLSEQIARAGVADVLVRFGDYPDLSGAAALPDKADKARFVFDALQRNARRHTGLLARLGRAGLRHEHLWAANAVFVAGADAAAVERLRHERGVIALRAVPTWRIDALEREPVVPPGRKVALAARSATPTWGLRFLGVPEVWAQGVRGAGAVVGGADTGFDWDHPALRAAYRGSTGATVEHAYNWYDGVREPFPGSTPDNPCGFGARVPCDDGFHGTHTMGTMVGETADELIGVAPEASWIACRNMDRNNGTPATYLACFQFFLAPTDLDGDNPRPELAPDVIANSWYCPASEGCNDSNFSDFDDIIDALRAAGTVVVASAGNSGRSGCNTISRVPARAPGAFVVGAHDSLGTIAAFSARGDARVDTDRVRPDVALPGVAVRSSIPDTGYASLSGTSMSGPHAVGVFALMISANPTLRGQVDTLEALFRLSATPKLPPAEDSCSAPGATVPNAVYGYGLGNALRAVELARAWGGLSGAAFAKTLRVGLSPNPTRGSVRVDLRQTTPGQAVDVSVRDLTGRLVHTERVWGESSLLDLGGLPGGVYLVSVRDAGGSASELLVLE